MLIGPYPEIFDGGGAKIFYRNKSAEGGKSEKNCYMWLILLFPIFAKKIWYSLKNLYNNVFKIGKK